MIVREGLAGQRFKDDSGAAVCKRRLRVAGFTERREYFGLPLGRVWRAGTAPDAVAVKQAEHARADVFGMELPVPDLVADGVAAKAARSRTGGGQASAR